MNVWKLAQVAMQVFIWALAATILYAFSRHLIILLFNIDDQPL